MNAPQSSAALIATTLLLTTFWPLPTQADSLLELFCPDPLDELDAPEASARTRKGQVVYPASGLPSIIRPGEEVVARVRVRRAMTPPPGVQQRHFLNFWSARLTASVPLSVSGTTGAVDLPLEVVQIRPEDEGFVYRVRLRAPGFAPDGVYDLIVDGPGLFDVAHRAVRVISRRREGLELVTVSRGVDLWREAEGLWLRDPAAVLVPGELLESALPLSRWPLATLATPSAAEASATRCLRLDQEMVAAVAGAAGCPSGGPGRATCVLSALGGPTALDPCGDELLHTLRRSGPPTYAVGLGAVTIVGLQTFDAPHPQRASARVTLAGETVTLPPPRDPERPTSSLEQIAWLERQARLSQEMIVLGANLRELDAAREQLERAAGAARTVELGAEPLELRLEARRPPPRWEQPRPWGFEPGGLTLASARPRPELEPAGIRWRATDEGVTVEARRPPPGKLTLRFLVPLRPEGWTLESTGRRGRVVEVAPGSADLCQVEQVVLMVEVAPGPSTPLTLRLRPGRAGGVAPSLRLIQETRPSVVGLPIELRVERRGLDGDGGDGPGATRVHWTFGDGAEALGDAVRHRYIRSGPTQVCAAAFDLRGRSASAGARLQVRRRGTRSPARRRWTEVGAAGLAAMLLALVLLGWRKGNIVLRRGR